MTLMLMLMWMLRQHLRFPLWPELLLIFILFTVYQRQSYFFHLSWLFGCLAVCRKGKWVVAPQLTQAVQKYGKSQYPSAIISERFKKHSGQHQTLQSSWLIHTFQMKQILLLKRLTDETASQITEVPPVNYTFVSNDNCHFYLCH